MQRFELSAQSRNDTGKGVARKLRAAGQIPAILYGAENEPLPIAVDRREITMLLRHHEGLHMLVDLQVEGEKTERSLTMIQDVAIDPVNRMLLHADFWRVDANKKMRTMVPIHPVGAPIGVKEGGVLQHLTREIEVEATPADLPEVVEVDISNLHVGESIHVSDLSDGESPYTILTEGDRVISTITVAKLSTASEDEGEGEGAEEEASED
jgi:large subunit ribosomal protein L25